MTDSPEPEEGLDPDEPIDRAEAIVETLAPLTPPPDVRETLRPSNETTLVLTSEDLAATPDETLLDADTSHMARVTYVVGLARLSKFLRKTPTVENEEPQARLALAYIKHAEDKLLAALQIGRGNRDDRLAREIGTMREEVRRLSMVRAENILKEKRKAKK